MILCQKAQDEPGGAGEGEVDQPKNGSLLALDNNPLATGE